MLAILGTPHRQREKISENKGGWVPFIFAMIGRPAGRIPAPILTATAGTGANPAATKGKPPPTRRKACKSMR
jgi:hypothetical protein